MTAVLLLGLLTIGVVYGLTSFVRAFAIRNAVIDIPNERSSHTRPTPRGGGVAIVAALLAAFTVSRMLSWIDADVYNAITGGGSLVAVAGWLDDRHSLSARTRLALQAVAAAWALYCLGGFPELRVGPATLSLGFAGPLLGVVGIVWLVNLYNFMDGIDGIAAVEGVTVGAGAAILSVAAGALHIAAPSVLLASACIGFLGWNWMPARIFMGDTGSGFLGYALGVLALASEVSGGLPLLLWMVLLGVFIVDTTVTLLRRASRRQRLADAHRLHAYQRAVQSGQSHARVTTAVGLLNAALFALAAIGMSAPRLTVPLVAVAALLLGLVYIAIENFNPMFDRER